MNATKWTERPRTLKPYDEGTRQRVTAIFGAATPDFDQLERNEAEADRQRRSDFVTSLLALTLKVPAGKERLVDQMSLIEDNACCNAARQLYRIAKGNVHDLINAALRARYGLSADCEPALRLKLRWNDDWKARLRGEIYVPAEGTTWGDQDFSHGIRP